MKPAISRFAPLLILCLLLSMAGCASAIKDDENVLIVASTEAFTRFSGEYENTAYFLKHKPASIAVLPFEKMEDKSYSISYDSENPPEIVRRGLYNHIASLPFKDLELHQTDQRLKNAGFTDPRTIDALIADNPGKLKSILGVDAVFTGKVTHFDRIYAGIYSQTAVGCEVKFWDLKSGRLLWRVTHVQRAHAGGISTSPVGLIISAMASIWNLKQEEMLSQTDDLFREIVSTIDLPTSARIALSAAPRIDMFAAVNAVKPFTLGQKAVFRIVGDPGGQAVVDLGDFKSGIALAPVTAQRKAEIRGEVLETIRQAAAAAGQEMSPEMLASVSGELENREIYEGAYQVAPDEQAYGLTARAYLVNADGMQAQAIDAVHLVDIDSLPPAPVGDVITAPLDGKVHLTWAASDADDLAGYEIWTSASPISGFTRALTSEPPEAMISGVDNFDLFYARVRAVDKAGNTGSFSKALAAVALPAAGLLALPQPGPTLGGVVSAPILLSAQKSPFTVTAPIRVTAGGAITIAPGATLLFNSGAAIIVEGGSLFAYGTLKRPVRMAPPSDTAGPGAWEGIVFTNAGESGLTHVVIEKANTGVRIQGSAPSLRHITISQSAQAGLHLMDNAAPEVTCCTFNENQGQGAIVLEGAGLSPRFRSNTFINNDPFQVQSYAPIQVDMSRNYWGTPQPAMEGFLGDIVIEPVLTAVPDECAAP
ncbi:MAG: GNA1162 family protein [Pseudomonadota bacterium]